MKDTKDTLGDRIKKYEDAFRYHLPPKSPTIIRLDGCHFHTFTKGFNKPYDLNMFTAMVETAKELIKIQGAKLIYSQSDEISILLNDYTSSKTSAWFDKNLQKITSVSASMATLTFNKNIKSNKSAYFDSRAFYLPKEEVCNYFIWRQNDAIRNSISGLAQINFSAKQLNKKNCSEMLKMLETKNIIWDNCLNWAKYGWCVYKESKFNEEKQAFRTEIILDENISKFSKCRDYINRWI
jgi:tRNA(His) 5'-end guanylyltransferase